MRDSAAAFGWSDLVRIPSARRRGSRADGPDRTDGFGRREAVFGGMIAHRTPTAPSLHDY
jgi:hypothetical protein